MTSRISKTHIVLILILLLSLLLRVYKIDQVPAGFWFDEAAFGYSAYSVLETGRDEFGVLLPTAFKNFGQHREPLYFYWLVPFIKILGLSVLSIRLGSAILGVLTTLTIYLLGRRLFGQRSVSLLAAFLYAISPFALQFGRMQHENNLLVFLITIASYFFLLARKQHRYLLLSGILFSLAFYTYVAARVFIPLFILLHLSMWWDGFRNYKRGLVKVSVVMFILLIPLMQFLSTPNAWPRVKEVSVIGDIGVLLNISEERQEHNVVSANGRVFHNKGVDFARVFLKNYLDHFSADFLIFNGDPNKLYSTPNIGIMYVWELIAFFIGMHMLLSRRDKKAGVYLLIWMLIGFLPAAMTKFVPSSSRSLQVIPAISLISAVGLYTVWKRIQKTKYRLSLTIIGAVLIMGNFIYYLDNYYIHLPVRYAYAWRSGSQEVVDRVSELESSFEKVVVDQEGISYINFLFFLKYPPELVQKEAVLTSPDEFGFSYIPKIGKYYFEKNPPQYLEEGVLYVGRKSWIGDRGEIIDRVDRADADNAYYILQKE